MMKAMYLCSFLLTQTILATVASAAKLYARANVVSPPSSNNTITAQFSFTGTTDGGATFVKVAVLGGLLPSLSSTAGVFTYHIHTNPISSDGNCSKALAHLDPYNATESLTCDPAFPQYCQEGDLSGKHGKLNVTATGTVPAFGYSDPYLRFFPNQLSILGRSIVIHSADKTRLACGNITSLLDGTEDALGKPTFHASSVTTTYPSVAPPQPAQVITPLTGTVFPNATDLALAPFPLPSPALTLAEALNLTLRVVNANATITPVNQSSPIEVLWSFIAGNITNFTGPAPFDGSIIPNCTTEF